MRASDQMLARLGAEIEQQQTFQDKLIEDAEKDGRDLTDNEMELFTRSRDQAPAAEHADRAGPRVPRDLDPVPQSMIADLARFTQDESNQPPAQVEYRTAGEYVLDYWKGSLGAQDAMKRMDLYNRAASHQTTADNPGLLPTPIVGPVVNFIDLARPITTWLGPRQIPAQTWTRPKVTQHTSVAPQPVGEKNELVSQKMTITKTAVTANTYGGYVNVSRQDIDWSTPSIMDLVISDLAGEYGVVTEAALGAALLAGATAGTIIPTGPATTDELAGALWAATAAVYATTKGQGRVAFFAQPGHARAVGPAVRPRQPGHGAVGRVPGVRLQLRADGRDLGDPHLHVAPGSPPARTSS